MMASGPQCDMERHNNRGNSSSLLFAVAIAAMLATAPGPKRDSERRVSLGACRTLLARRPRRGARLPKATYPRHARHARRPARRATQPRTRARRAARPRKQRGRARAPDQAGDRAARARKAHVRAKSLTDTQPPPKGGDQAGLELLSAVLGAPA